MLGRSQWKAWAVEWALAHRPQCGLLARDERVTGVHRGLVVDVRWRGRHGSELAVAVRFPRGHDPSELRARIACDPNVSAIPGWRRVRGGAEARRRERKAAANPAAWVPPDLYAFSVFDSTLVWRQAFPWRRPDPADVRRWVEALVQATARVTGHLDGRCEECATGLAEGFLLVHDEPHRLCAACRGRRLAEGVAAELDYDRPDANHARGAIYAAVAAAAGALAWARLAPLGHGVGFGLALGMAALVSWGYRRGARKVDRPGQAIAAAGAVLGALLGEVLRWTWVVAQERPGAGFRLEAGFGVFVELVSRNPGAVLVLLALAAIGAALTRDSLRSLWRLASSSSAEPPPATTDAGTDDRRDAA